MRESRWRLLEHVMEFAMNPSIVTRFSLIVSSLLSNVMKLSSIISLICCRVAEPDGLTWDGKGYPGYPVRHPGRLTPMLLPPTCRVSLHLCRMSTDPVPKEFLGYSRKVWNPVSVHLTTQNL